MLDIELFIQKINKKSRLIGIDPGGKRIGIAISDENKIVATPYTTLIKENYSKLLLEIKKIFKENFNPFSAYLLTFLLAFLLSCFGLFFYVIKSHNLADDSGTFPFTTWLPRGICRKILGKNI